MTRLAFFTLCLASLAAQEAAAPLPTPTELITRFRALSGEQRSNVLRNLERRFARDDYDPLQRIQALQKGKGAYAGPIAPRWFEPRDYAPNATPRTLLGIGAAAHGPATRGMLPFTFLANLESAVTYDWLQGKAVHRGEELTELERFTNFAHGYAPGADHAIAQMLATLDSEPQQRRLGSYFEHLYADRNGAVFAKVSLYDAWRSQRQLEMPDTDAIAFARLVLETRSFSAPLPADRRRDRLYAKMRDAFADHRDHRTLLLALAGTFVVAEPQLEPGYEGLVDRAHWLWYKADNNASTVGERLRQNPGRGDLFRVIDAALPADFDAVTARKQSLVKLANHLRNCADQELQNVGG